MKQAYKNIQLTKTQKRNLIKKTIQPPQPKNKFVPFIAVGFIAICILFFVLSIQSTQSIQHTASINDFSYLKEDLSSVILYSTVTFILLISSYTLFLFIINQPKLLIRFRLIRFMHSIKGTWKMFLFFLTPIFILAFIASIIAVTTEALFILQFTSVTFLLCNAFCIQLLYIKERPRASCPYCGVELTNKEIMLNKTCGICGHGKQKDVKNSSKEFLMTFGGLIYIIFPAIQIPIIITIFYLVIYFGFTFFYIQPYIVRYIKEEELPKPLW